MDQSHNGHQQRGGPLPPLPPQVWQNQIEPVFQHQAGLMGHQPGFMQMPPFVVANVRIFLLLLFASYLFIQ